MQLSLVKSVILALQIWILETVPRSLVMSVPESVFGGLANMSLCIQGKNYSFVASVYVGLGRRCPCLSHRSLAKLDVYFLGERSPSAHSISLVDSEGGGGGQFQ